MQKDREFVAADGQRRTELRRGILNETVIVASDRTVHGLFVPSKQEAGAYIYRRDWWDFLPNKWDRKGGKY